MKSELNIEERKPLWIALSKLYVDTELQDYDFKHIASKIKESPYSFEEVKQINKAEVFPVLFWNLLSVAGVWTGFKEEWLVNEVTLKVQKGTSFDRYLNRIKYWCFKGMFKDYWEELEGYFQNP